MIIVSNGLDAIASGDQYRFLFKFFSQSFHTNNVYDTFLSMLKMRQYFFFKNNKPIAVVSFKKRGFVNCTGTYYTNVLYNVATSPYYRRKGYMKQLLYFIIDEMRKQRRKYLHLEVLKDNEKAINLYKKLGFEIIYECDPSFSLGGIYLMRLCLRR